MAGAAGAGLTSVAAPHVAGYLIGQGVEPSTAAALTSALAFGTGSAAGGMANADMATVTARTWDKLTARNIQIIFSENQMDRLFVSIDPQEVK